MRFRGAGLRHPPVSVSRLRSRRGDAAADRDSNGVLRLIGDNRCWKSKELRSHSHGVRGFYYTCHAAGIEKSPGEASPFASTEPVVIQKLLLPRITATNIPRRLTRPRIRMLSASMRGSGVASVCVSSPRQDALLRNAMNKSSCSVEHGFIYVGNSQLAER